MRALFVLCAGACLLLACERGREPAAPAAPPAVQAEVSIAGLYKVKGMTVEKESGHSREIQGTVTLAQEGDRWTTSFELKTDYPTADGPAEADVIGTGKGKLDGRKLEGVAETQLVMAAVPGVNTAFAYIPRIVGPRLISTTTGELGKDGTLRIEIENEPAEGEVYAATHTTLRGTRISR
jgi:hypothetical protein